jgi:type IV secretory pathway VirB4 component
MATPGTPSKQFVPVEDVRDGVVVLKDGTICAILLVSSINLSLKSTEEQQATLQQFQAFLNTIDFPIEIVVQSRRYDIRPYLLTLEERLKQQTEQLLQVQTREYIEFIRSFNDQVNIMRKSFFVVIPYVPAIITQKKGVGRILTLFQKKESVAANDVSTFEEERTQLEERISVVDQGLSRLGLRVAQLGTQEVIELYYKTFNPGETTSEAQQQNQSAS